MAERERERERGKERRMLFLVARYKLSGAVAAVAVSLMGLAKCGSARLFVAAAFHVLVPCFTFGGFPALSRMPGYKMAPSYYTDGPTPFERSSGGGVSSRELPSSRPTSGKLSQGHKSFVYFSYCYPGSLGLDRVRSVDRIPFGLFDKSLWNPFNFKTHLDFLSHTRS